jgi:GLPGLI family protein
MKKLIILLVLSFANFQAEGQNVKNTYEVIYRLEHSSDSTNIKDKSVEDFHLFIGDNKSKFISKNQRIRDSIVTKMEENFNGSINFANKNMPKTKFNEIIFKDYKNNKLKIVDRIGSDEFLYSEVIQPYTWEIKQDKKVINDFKVQKAVTKFGGREFIAWFTEEIAIPQGPYKFEGLPGLIVQISDTENHYNYQLISFKEVNGDKQIEDLDININYIKTSKQEFYKAKRDYYANYFVRLNEKGISLGLSLKKNEKFRKSLITETTP